MADFEIRIRTTADLAATQRLKRALEEQIQATRDLGREDANLEAQLRAVNSALDTEAAKLAQLSAAQQKATDSVRDLSQSPGTPGAPGADPASLTDTANLAGTLGGVITRVGAQVAGVTLGIGALAQAFRGLISTTVEAENVSAALDTALAQRGLLTDDYRLQLHSLARQLEETTRIADEQWLAALQKLTQQGAEPHSIGMDIEAVKNLAGLLGGDMLQAANAIGRAINGNFELFSRWGIVLDQNATQTEKLKKLYEELALRGGGQLEAMARTLSGEWGNLKNAVGNLSEAIGTAISSTGALQGVMQFSAETIQFWANLLGSAPAKLDGLVNAQRRTTSALDDGSSSARKYRADLDSVRQAAELAARVHEILRDRITDASRAQLEAVDVTLAERLAEIDTAQKSGQLGEGDAARARATVQRQAAFAQLGIEEQRDKDLQAVQESRLAQAEAEKAALEAQIRQTAELEQKVGAFEAAQARLSNAQTKFDASLTQADKQLFKGRPASAVQPIVDAATENRRIGRLADELLTARSAVPKGAPGSAELAARRAELEAELDTVQTRNAPIIESAARDIGAIQFQRATRATLGARRIEAQARQAGLDPAVTDAAAQAAKLQADQNRLLKTNLSQTVATLADTNAFITAANQAMAQISARLEQLASHQANLRNR